MTANSTYTAAAIASANWIKAQNINSDYLVLDTVNAHDCTTSPSTWLFTYNSGKYVEGLSVLATVTGDSQWSDLAVNIINAAVKSSVWEGSDGIITEGSDTTRNNDGVGFKGAFYHRLFLSQCDGVVFCQLCFFAEFTKLLTEAQTVTSGLSSTATWMYRYAFPAPVVHREPHD
jgi:hypothetical protein